MIVSEHDANPVFSEQFAEIFVGKCRCEYHQVKRLLVG